MIKKLWLYQVTLPDGTVKEGESWKTTPFMIAQGISQGLAESTVISKVNGELWDLERPFEADSTLRLLKFDDDEAKAVSNLSFLLSLKYCLSLFFTS